MTSLKAGLCTGISDNRSEHAGALKVIHRLLMNAQAVLSVALHCIFE